MRKLLFALLAGLLLATGAAAAYSDVPEDHWAASAIAEMTELHVTAGFPDGSFHPDEPVSRAQFLAMVVRACSEEEIPTAGDGEAWWQPYYDEAWGLFSSASLGQAEMIADINRYEMAMVLDNANCRWNGLRLTAGWEKAGRFSDEASIPTQYAANVESAAASGLLSGFPDGSFQGGKTMTRAQACLVIHRLLDKAELLGKGETQVAYTGEILIKYALKSDGSAVLTSVRASDGDELQAMTVPMDNYAGYQEQWQDSREEWAAAWGRTVLDADRSAFWGEIGYYTYAADGFFTQWNQRAVLSWIPDPAGDGILAISHEPGKRVCYHGAGVINPAGDEVVRLRRDGTEDVLLSNTPAHGLTLTHITGVEDGVVRVVYTTIYGMTDVHSWEYAVEGGKLRALEHEPGKGFTGYTPEEAAIEQARLDAAGCGVGSQ